MAAGHLRWNLLSPPAFVYPLSPGSTQRHPLATPPHPSELGHQPGRFFSTVGMATAPSRLAAMAPSCSVLASVLPLATALSLHCRVQHACSGGGPPFCAVPPPCPNRCPYPPDKPRRSRAPGAYPPRRCSNPHAPPPSHPSPAHS
jgi:hypothetical protein